MSYKKTFFQTIYKNLKTAAFRLMVAATLTFSLITLSSFIQLERPAAGVPFWGDDCYYVGIVGGIDGPCYHYHVCTRYRFWINFGSYDRYQETDCP